MAIIDLVRWSPQGAKTIYAYRFPETNLSTYTQLIVQESQEAVLFSKGQIVGKFGPGKHTLNTENLPILRNLFGIPFGGKNPFTAEVWFINKLQPYNIDWAIDKMPIHDPDYNTQLPLVANGCYGLKIRDAEKFIMRNFLMLLFCLTVFSTVELAGKIPPTDVVSTTMQRLQRDWMYQDHGLDIDECFAKPATATQKDAAIESAMVQKVVAEITNKTVQKSLQNEAKTLASIPGDDPRWKELYFKACEIRRQERLATLAKNYRKANSGDLKIVYTKHYMLSGPCQMHPTDMVTDNPYKEQLESFRPGAQLRLLTIGENGTTRDEVLLETSEGLIRDPNLSFDATKIVFSMRKNFETDDYHLYVLDLSATTGKGFDNVKQITFGEACSDVEPAFLPDGNLVFQSTRCVQLTDCWPVPASNLYICAADGRYLHRVGFDQVHTLYPQVLDNGLVIYTRWEYNDRNPVHQQPLFQMNSDGTAQTSFYGGGSFYPTAIIHARGVPGTGKVIAIASGHHVDQRGKLIMIDRSEGSEGNAGISFLAPTRKSDVPVTTTSIFGVNDAFGQSGEQFQYPCALDENNYLVAYLPEGGPRAKYPVPFGVYWMNADGKRELLAYDSEISCGQPLPLVARAVPQVKPSNIDLAQNTGKYYAINVYEGQGLPGIEPGTIKSMRVVGIEFRAGHVKDGTTQGENKAFGARGSRDRVTTPIAAGSGSWEVKHVLGEVPVEEDGSVYVEVPARTPVYFQLLDEKGYVVQTMRSWTTLQPGETFACVGCHENKNTTVSASSKRLPIAIRKPAQKLLPKTNKYGSLNSVDSYLTVNSSKGFDRVDGFSYTQQIQPVWDKHCISCHNGVKEPEAKQDAIKSLTAKASLLDLRGTVHEDLKNDLEGHSEHPWQRNGRAYLTSYLQLTNYGVSGKLINWVDAESVPMILPPYFNGSSQSKLMSYLEPLHHNVSLTPDEKRLIACWIDICVPFCGSYTEANEWNDQEKATYRYFEEKRTRFAEIELDNLRELQQSQNENSSDKLKMTSLP